MSVSYTWVGWTRSKVRYDLAIGGLVLLYLGTFVGLNKALLSDPAQGHSDEVLLIRALGTCAILMLHVILWIGPLARLFPRLIPLLFNRRHLGVATFLVALAHAALSTFYYHGFGNSNPLVSLLDANTQYASLTHFPFEILGLIALAILFVLASTSHDFWLSFLGARIWKRLHMLVYFAYALLIFHVALGVLQSERNYFFALVLGIGIIITVSLHLITGARSAIEDLDPTGSTDEGLLDVCAVEDIPEKRAVIVCPRGRERIAVFKHDGKVSAVTNVCAHQGGPLGEGKVVDGCITCPWHGWQYRPENGTSPPPFHEKVTTYQVRVRAGRVLVDPTPLPPGTPVESARTDEAPTKSGGLNSAAIAVNPPPVTAPRIAEVPNG